MKSTILDRLVCPDCGAGLILFPAQSDGEVPLRGEAAGGGPCGASDRGTPSAEGARTEETVQGRLECKGAAHAFPIVGSIPRFVPGGGVCDSFGYQWERYARTQIDRFNGTEISKRRLRELSGWDLGALTGERILEIGCGAGRFTQILADAGAEVFALDMSGAVDVNLRNNGLRKSVHYFQADLHQLPFRSGSFDRVLCVNVLQHTPHVRQAFLTVVRFVKARGHLAANVYKRTLRSTLNWKYLMRPLTTRMRRETLHAWIEKWSPALLALSDFFASKRVLNMFARRVIPIHNYRNSLPLAPEQILDWAILDTFDSLSPRYDNPQRPGTLERWFVEAGFEIVQSADDGCSVTGILNDHIRT